jgi:hypothetical protein
MSSAITRSIFDGQILPQNKTFRIDYFQLHEKKRKKRNEFGSVGILRNSGMHVAQESM